MSDEIKEHLNKANAFIQLALDFAKNDDREGVKRHFEWAEEQITQAKLIVWSKCPSSADDYYDLANK